LEVLSTKAEILPGENTAGRELTVKHAVAEGCILLFPLEFIPGSYYSGISTGSLNISLTILVVG
jgi:hypothetical protein